MTRVLVTGATGNAGREVVAALVSRAFAVRAASRRAGADQGAVETTRLDFADARTHVAAARGCSAVFLVRPPAIADVASTLLPFLEVAWTEGVEHVVFLSVAGAEKNRFIPHATVERHLRASGRPWTLLRPGFFAQNLQDAYRRDIVEDDRLLVPAGRGTATFVDLRDVAEVAAEVFASPERHRGNAYTLTGPEAVSFERVAEILSTELGRRVRYEPASLLRYGRHLRSRGQPLAQIAVQSVLHLLLRYGRDAPVDPTLARLLGRAPRSLADYVRDHVSIWER